MGCHKSAVEQPAQAACIKVGSEIDVICDGDGENEALAEAAAMIESGFGE